MGHGRPRRVDRCRGGSLTIARVSRQGDVVIQTTKDFTAKTVQKAVEIAVRAGSRLSTDSASGYRAVKGYLHAYVNHTQKEAAENLFLRKQLALYQERHIQPRRATNATRLALVWLARWFDRRQALAMVQPATFIRWHRQGFRLFWRWQSRPGRPRIPVELQALIRQMAQDNPTWGQERIANELLPKLGLRVSPRTVRKYMPSHCVGSPGKRGQSQRWATCVRNHAHAIVACDFCVAVTATFRILPPGTLPGSRTAWGMW